MAITNTEHKNNAQWYKKEILTEVKKICADNLSNIEFEAFVQLGLSLDLNPFKKEIWAVKQKPHEAAMVIVGINGYRAVAQRNPLYEYHQADAVHENDQFMVKDGEVYHNYVLKDRGRLVGAYCKVKRKNTPKPTFVYVDFAEYDKKHALWKPAAAGGKPATMIKKVAEAHALRQAFAELNGTYTDDELPDNIVKPENNVIKITETQTQTEKLKNIINVDKNTGEVIEEKATSEQIQQIQDLINIKEFNEERLSKAFEYYKIKDLQELNIQKAELFIHQLRRL